MKPDDVISHSDLVGEENANLRMHSLPASLLADETPSYDDFLEQRRKFMSLKIKTSFKAF